LGNDVLVLQLRTLYEKSALVAHYIEIISAIWSLLKPGITSSFLPMFGFQRFDPSTGSDSQDKALYGTEWGLVGAGQIFFSDL
jgi:hypothetical protein